MPNWCYQELEVQGNKDELQRFVDACQDTYTDEETGETKEITGLNHFFPIPKELCEYSSPFTGSKNSDPFGKVKLSDKEVSALARKHKKLYGAIDWYEWANLNWGTKWGARDLDWTNLDDNNKVPDDAVYVSAHFESAWSPAEGLINKISGMFPTLVFSIVYTEESDAFVGYSVFVNGKQTHEEGAEPSMPEELSELFEKDDPTMYDEQNDWRCEYADKFREMRTHAVGEVTFV